MSQWKSFEEELPPPDEWIWLYLASGVLYIHGYVWRKEDNKLYYMSKEWAMKVSEQIATTQTQEKGNERT